MGYLHDMAPEELALYLEIASVFAVVFLVGTVAFTGFYFMLPIAPMMSIHEERK